MITDQEVKYALSILQDPKRAGAKARASHEFLTKQEKIVKARLMQQSNEKSAAAKEIYALAHPDYEAACEHTKELAEIDYIERERRAAASATIEMWRTEQSNERAHVKTGM